MKASPPLDTETRSAASAAGKANLCAGAPGDETKLETIFSVLRDGLLFFDSSGILMQANPVAQNMLKVDASAIGHNLSTLLKSSVQSADFGDYDLGGALEAALSGLTVSGVMTLTGGGRVTAQAYIMPLKDGPTGASGVILLISDRSELSQLDEMKSNFVSNVSHELRTPLTSIYVYVDLLLAGRAGTLTSKQKQYLTVVKEQAVNLAKTIEDLLNLSRMKSPGERVKLEKAYIVDAIEESIKRLEDQARQKDIGIEAEVPPDLPPAAADAARVVQVVTNILDNAIKFTPPSGHVEISATKKEPYIQVRVKDNGIGIPPAALPRIFDRMFQAKNGDSADLGGFGLGLAISREIIDFYGGTIWAESEPGMGSTFFFTVPLYSGNATSD
jgi:signal transduction histidine kinase